MEMHFIHLDVKRKAVILKPTLRAETERIFWAWKHFHWNFTAERTLRNLLEILRYRSW